MARQLIHDIELGGASRRLNFGMVCWEFFCERMDVGPTDILPAFMGKTSFRAMRILVYSAIAADDFIKQQPVSVTEAEVAGWLNEDPGKIGEIFTLAARVLAPELDPLVDGVEQKVGDDGTKKKRSRSRKSNASSSGG